MSETMTDQPAPTPGFAFVEPEAIRITGQIAKEQFNKGMEEYGTPLMAGNGRDALMDALAEANDLQRYVVQAILERDHMAADNLRLRAAITAALDSAEGEDIHLYRGTDEPREFYRILTEASEK